MVQAEKVIPQQHGSEDVCCKMGHPRQRIPARRTAVHDTHIIKMTYLRKHHLVHGSDCVVPIDQVQRSAEAPITSEDILSRTSSQTVMAYLGFEHCSAASICRHTARADCMLHDVDTLCTTTLGVSGALILQGIPNRTLSYDHSGSCARETKHFQ
ncbi:hypothetical protein BR93DRAFT_45262 [Coniochaeta sp. PMI_546]|nr:hypothetical protein BR93DRAFT_45262 [Coniochaeta sp. PMI_546]